MSLFKQRAQRSVEGRPACTTCGAGCAQYVLMVAALFATPLGALKATDNTGLPCLLVSLCTLATKIDTEQKSLHYDVDGALLLSH